MLGLHVPESPPRGRWLDEAWILEICSTGKPGKDQRDPYNADPLKRGPEGSGDCHSYSGRLHWTSHSFFSVSIGLIAAARRAGR
jgi:hypothetical protein